MKHLLCLMACLAGFTIGLQAQTGDLHVTTLSMVETERAFAHTAEVKGTRPSFMDFIADDGILFRPKAVKGKQWMIDHPLPVSDKPRDLLSWGPSFADLSAAGDMGYTFGPWKYKRDINDEKPGAFGHFVTIWKRQTDGSWKFAVDLGISHPESTVAEPILAQLPGRTSTNAVFMKPQKPSSVILAAEEKFAADAMTLGARKAFEKHAAARSHLFREGKLPVEGRIAASELLPANPGLWSWKAEGWDISRSADLGYSYGTYWLKPTEPSGKTETGNYFRIWRKEDGRWRVVVDLANPVPEK
jgi:ketosteroid isomerase-like protein